ncbi:MAG: biopolymer transporter ExbD [Flavobacteriaceae bacterium]|nr:biopolymer transporter ExbD [Flavobacteriaceae bacterium]
MRLSKRSRPEVNAGSMADIAFLLLIFFLVTATVPKDKGFNRKLSKLCQNPPCDINTHKRNILQVLLNDNDEIMINDKITHIQNVANEVKAFVDNNGDSSCTYCDGPQLANASDNPKEAIISLQTSPKASYDAFIDLQNEITRAYNVLRSQYAQEILNVSLENLSKDDIKAVKDAYPFILSEAHTKE